MDCAGYKTTCKKCGRRFKRGDKTNPCPDCGEDRHCGKSAVSGYKFCEVHGGPNPSKGYYGHGRGIVTGSSSSFPLTKLAAKRNELRNNGVFLSNSRSIEIVRRRLEELLNRIDKNQAPDRLDNLHKLWKKFRREEHSDPTQAPFTKKEIDAEFEAAYHDYAAWNQMFDVLRLDKELIESEVKIAKDLHAMLTAEDAYTLIADVFSVIMNIEEDPMKLKRYQFELTRLIGERPG